MRLSRFTECLNGLTVRINGLLEGEVYSISIDSNNCEKGALYVCLCGQRTDGHEYAAQAVKNGAVAIVCERALPMAIPQIIVENTRKALGRLAAEFYGNAAQYLKIIGITGTNGKTTTSYMLAEILKTAGKKVGIIGTLGVVYGGKRQALSLTTPDPIELHRIFAEMRLAGVEYVVMEVSAHALYHYKTEGVFFYRTVFTNFTQDHLDFFSDMESYKETKLRLFKEKGGVAVVNGDTETGREIVRLREKKGEKTILYGLNSPADAFAVITEEGLYGTECMLNINDALCRISLSLTGKHNVYNALAAATCAMTMGIQGDAVTDGLSNLSFVEGRLQRVAAFHGGDVFVDFAHTPDGLKNVLAGLKGYCKGRLICLFGCGGNRDKIKRGLMGEIAARLSDFTVLTSDNPRYEDPLDILSEIEKGYRRFSAKYVIVPDRKCALSYALDFMQKGDVLLVAGKGGERYQEVMGIKYPFNDHDIIKELLEQKGKTLPL